MVLLFFRRGFLKKKSLPSSIPRQILTLHYDPNLSPYDLIEPDNPLNMVQHTNITNMALLSRRIFLQWFENHPYIQLIHILFKIRYLILAQPNLKGHDKKLNIRI